MLKRLASFRLRRNEKRLREIQLVQDSGLFNPTWYSRHYPEVDGSGLDPVSHFLERGWQDGHDPGPEFSTAAYLRDNADVARSGMNPLLHYLEFGVFEGREASGESPLVPGREPTSFKFERAAPASCFPITPTKPASWRRARDLSESDQHIIRRGGLLIGLIDDIAVRDSTHRAFDLLGLLSGFEAGGSKVTSQMDDASEQMVDAWYLSSSQLRTRWDSKVFPLVIRAYQHDPLLDGSIGLVGEGLITTSIDVFDLHLKNPLFPILFLFFKPDGILIGSMLLSFPSLCRRGLHYCELLAGHVDVLTESFRLQRRLIKIVTQEAMPLVTSVKVDLEGSDGTGPMFQKYCRLWLEKVMRVEVAGILKADRSPVANFLREAVTVRPASTKRGNHTSLWVGSDMLPTIAALTEEASEGMAGDRADVLLPMLIAQPSENLAGVLIEPPREPIESIDALLDAGAWKWPKLGSSDGLHHSKFPQAGAVRYSRNRPITEAERYMPVAGTMSSGVQGSSSITWLIEPSRWSIEVLSDSVAALAMLEGAESAALIMIGTVDRALRAIIAATFPGRVNGRATRAKALSDVDTVLTGHIGPNVIVHDNRTTSLFSRLLNDSRVATASCVLLDVERRGRNWRVDVGDGGNLRGVHRAVGSRSDYATAINSLWRCTYAVATPPRDLWVARSSDVRELILKGSYYRRDDHARHICSSLVTASRIARGRDAASDESHLIPGAVRDRATAFRVLVG